MTNNLEESKLFYIFSKNLATSINFCTGKTFQKRNNEDGTPIYTFLNCKEIREAVEELTNLKKKYRK